jgi:hypothetical protein
LRKGKICMESTWLCTLITTRFTGGGHKIFDENSGHGFNATSTVFAGPGA